MTPRPKDGTLLTQNSELKKDGIWCWTLPAFNVRTPSGAMFNTCPNAGACARLCYARQGTFNFPSVKEAHMKKLMWVLEDLDGWREAMTVEIGRKKHIPYLRIHDAGDFFSREYLEAWVLLARRFPETIFYAYTKEVAMFKDFSAAGRFPSNFRFLFSMGGRQDHLIDRECDRHAEVFPSLMALMAAGYSDQGSSDLLAVTLPTNRIGIVSNNIPSLRKMQNLATFGDIQKAQDAKRMPPQ